MHIFISHSFIAGIEWKHRAFSRHGKNGGKKLQSRKHILSRWSKWTTLDLKFDIPSVARSSCDDMSFRGSQKFFCPPKSTFAKNSGREKLEIVFSTSIVRCLPQLRHLIVRGCKELKHIIEDDVENIKGSNYLSSRTSFPMLKLLVVVNCTKLKYWFPTSVSQELPELEVLMIREAGELEEIFKNEDDDDQKVEIPNLNVVAFVDLQASARHKEFNFRM